MTEQHDPVPASLRLQVAVDQLTQPEQVRLHRDPDDVQAAIAALDIEHVEAIRELRHRHGQARDAAAKRRLINGMTTTGHRYRTKRARLVDQLAVTVAALPTLLEQLQDAVASSTSRGGAPAAGPYRSPIGLAAAELLGQIEREVGRGNLAKLLAAWQPTDIEEAAGLAERWVVEARNLLNPQRALEAKAACPVCGNRHAWVLDPERGERVRKAAIQITPDGARCISPGCTGRWDRAHLLLLAGVLRQDTGLVG